MQDEEDLHATAVASYIVLLAAHARGLAGYWRTPGCCAPSEGRAAVGLAEGERFVGLLHLGRPRQEPAAPRERPAEPRATRHLPRLMLSRAAAQSRRSPASASRWW